MRGTQTHTRVCSHNIPWGFPCTLKHRKHRSETDSSFHDLDPLQEGRSREGTSTGLENIARTVWPLNDLRIVPLLTWTQRAEYFHQQNGNHVTHIDSPRALLLSLSKTQGSPIRAYMWRRMVHCLLSESAFRSSSPNPDSSNCRQALAARMRSPGNESSQTVVSKLFNKII
jgi:hypothetical protein